MYRKETEVWMLILSGTDSMYDIWKGLHIFQPQIFYQEDAKDIKGQQKKMKK